MNPMGSCDREVESEYRSVKLVGVRVCARRREYQCLEWPPTLKISNPYLDRSPLIASFIRDRVRMGKI